MSLKGLSFLKSRQKVVKLKKAIHSPRKDDILSRRSNIEQGFAISEMSFLYCFKCIIDERLEIRIQVGLETSMQITMLLSDSGGDSGKAVAVAFKLIQFHAFNDLFCYECKMALMRNGAKKFHVTRFQLSMLESSAPFGN